MFHFRLQTLLRLRIADRDQRRGEFAKAQSAAEILRQQREQFNLESAENQALARRLAAPGQANMEALLQTHRYEAVLKVRLKLLATQETQVAAEVERRRQVLMEADRAVKVLEKLEERQRAEFERRSERREAKQLDEVATQNHVRQQEAGT